MNKDFASKYNALSHAVYEILVICFLVKNVSPESPRCERRLVCGSDGQVYETSCDFQRALRQNPDLGMLPLHECLGILYVVLPAEHSRALKNFVKPKMASCLGTKLAKGVQKSHNTKSMKSNAVLEVLDDIFPLQSRDDTDNLRALCGRGRGCPDTIYILPEDHFLPQKNLKSVVIPTRKMLSLLEYLPSQDFFSTIIQGIYTKVAKNSAPIIRIVVELIVVQVQKLIMNIIKGFVPTPQETNRDDSHNSNNNNHNYDNHNHNYDTDNHHNNINNQYNTYINLHPS